MVEMTRYSANSKYFSDNYDRLSREYRDQHVAILDERVVGYARDLEDLCNHLRRRGINPAGETYIGSLKENPRPLILLT